MTRYEVIEELNGPLGQFKVGWKGEVDAELVKAVPGKFKRIGRKTKQAVEVVEDIDEDNEINEDDYPGGATVNKILQWVGVDDERAQIAYEEELKLERPRNGVMITLETERDVTRPDSD